MDGELRHALPVLRRRDRRVEVEVTDEVNDEERDEEARRHDRRSRNARVTTGDAIGREADDESDGEQVGDADLPRHVPVELLECHREDRGEEEEPCELHWRSLKEIGELSHTGAAVELRAQLGREGRAVECAGRPAFMKRAKCLGERLGIVRCGDDAGAGLTDERSRSSVGWDGSEDRPFGGEVLEDLSREHAFAPSVRLGDQEQQRLGVPLQLERPPPGCERNQLQPVTKTERVRPLAVGSTEVADEASDQVEVRAGQRGEKRPRVAAAEEAPGMGDAKARDLPMCEAGKVVEIAAVGDRRDGRARSERSRLVGNRLRCGHDRVGTPSDEPGNGTACLLLRFERRRIRTAVGMGLQRIAKIGHPPRTRQTLDRSSDEMDRAGW